MSAWLLYGQRHDGELLHISEARRGEACTCFCPHCGAALAAKKGTINIHHFAHLGKTCAFQSAYDFLHIESFVDTSLSLSAWVAWKQKEMVEVGYQLDQQLPEYEKEMDDLKSDLVPARQRLELISQPHPSRKQRSPKRQSNYEVLQQWDHWLEDHNADELDLEKVRDLESCEYVTVNYQQYDRFGGYKYHIGLSVWPNEMWWEENKKEDWVPYWLAKAGIRLLNEYHPLRRKLVSTQQKQASFHAEKARFEKFRLYFLLIEFENRAPLFKVGITSRSDLSERISEIKNDLRSFGIRELSILIELPGHAYLESYFKKKYSTQQIKLGKLTEYFGFDELMVNEIVVELNQLLPQPQLPQKLSKSDRIKLSMNQARSKGVHIGREKGAESLEQFLAKDESRRIIDLLNQHPDWSLRKISKQANKAINTVCKVSNAYRQFLTSSPELSKSL